MAEEKKGFFKRLVSGLTKPVTISCPDLILFSADFHILMMIFTRNWKKFL